MNVIRNPFKYIHPPIFCGKVILSIFLSLETIMLSLVQCLEFDWNNWAFPMMILKEKAPRVHPSFSLAGCASIRLEAFSLGTWQCTQLLAKHVRMMYLQKRKHRTYSYKLELHQMWQALTIDFCWTQKHCLISPKFTSAAVSTASCITFMLPPAL